MIRYIKLSNPKRVLTCTPAEWQSINKHFSGFRKLSEDDKEVDHEATLDLITEAKLMSKLKDDLVKMAEEQGLQTDGLDKAALAKLLIEAQT